MAAIHFHLVINNIKRTTALLTCISHCHSIALPFWPGWHRSQASPPACKNVKCCGTDARMETYDHDYNLISLGTVPQYHLLKSHGWSLVMLHCHLALSRQCQATRYLDEYLHSSVTVQLWKEHMWVMRECAHSCSKWTTEAYAITKAAPSVKAALLQTDINSLQSKVQLLDLFTLHYTICTLKMVVPQYTW